MLYYLLFMAGMITGAIVLGLFCCIYVGKMAEDEFYENYKKIEDKSENK